MSIKLRSIMLVALASAISIIVIGCGPKDEDIPVVKGDAVPKGTSAAGPQAAPPSMSQSKASAKDFN